MERYENCQYGNRYAYFHKCVSDFIGAMTIGAAGKRVTTELSANLSAIVTQSSLNIIHE